MGFNCRSGDTLHSIYMRACHYVQKEEMQMFCTTDDEKLEQVDPADASNIPTDAQGGVARLHLLWDVEQIPKLKIHFLNDDILEDEHWKCGHAGPLTVDTILAWAAVWNSHADNYPQIAEGLATKEKAHIRVEFRSMFSFYIHCIVAKLFVL